MGKDSIIAIVVYRIAWCCRNGSAGGSIEPTIGHGKWHLHREGLIPLVNHKNSKKGEHLYYIERGEIEL